MDALQHLAVWARAVDLVVNSLKIIEPIGNKALRDQISRSMVSIPSNIAEGYERNSKKQFAQYLRIAKGSCGEARTQLHIANRLEYISSDDTDQLIEASLEISKMIHGLIKHCENASDS